MTATTSAATLADFLLADDRADVNVHLTLQSGNDKTGPIPVSTTEEDSCAPSCPLRGGDCYAKFGPLMMHWKAVSAGRRGGRWTLFCRAIARLAKGQLWRHNQAGDLPHREGAISASMVAELAEANRGRRGFTYTHHDPATGDNAAIIAAANAAGFTINLSADDLAEADALAALGIGPVVVTVPRDLERGTRTPAGLPVIQCPATTTQGTAARVQCSTCGICQLRDRRAIVAFPAHGPAGKRLAKRLDETGK